MIYRQISNISRTSVGNKIIDHSDVIGASPDGAAPTTSSFLDLTPGFNGLGRDNCKTRRETVKCCNLVQLKLEIWQWYCILFTWWRHQMETFSALLAICAGNSPVPGEFPTQRPVTRSFDVYFDLRPNNRWSKQSWGWWFETASCLLWRHRN